jgi:hypothetical protein
VWAPTLTGLGERDGRGGRRVRSRVGLAVFVDAFVPADGDSPFGLLRPERRAMFEEAARGGVVPAPRVEAWGVTDPERVAWMEARVTAQPLRCLGHRPRRDGDDAGGACGDPLRARHAFVTFTR